MTTYPRVCVYCGGPLDNGAYSGYTACDRCAPRPEPTQRIPDAVDEDDLRFTTARPSRSDPRD